MSEPLQPAWVDTRDGVRETADLCAAAGGFALDTEADSLHSYFHKVCLIQVTADGHHAVIDPLALGSEALEPLWEVVGDASLPTLMHGSDYDIRVLDRDFEVRIRGLLDTQIMARLLGEEKTGLATLIEREAGIVLDKKYQRADWGRRPLTPEQLAYAAADTAYLGLLADRLRGRLVELDRWGWAEEECRKLEGIRHAPVEPNPMAFERIKGARALRGEMRDRLFNLHCWRERQARSLDVPPFKILGNQQLMQLAQEPPQDLEELKKVGGVGPRVVRRWGREILADLRSPAKAPDRQRGPREPTPDPAVRRRLKRLMTTRDGRAQALGLEAGLLCPRSCAEEVAAWQPRCATKEDLLEAGLGGWRLEVLGDVFLAALLED